MDFAEESVGSLQLRNEKGQGNRRSPLNEDHHRFQWPMYEIMEIPSDEAMTDIEIK